MVRSLGGGWGNWTGGVRLGLLDEMALNETFGHKSVAFVHPVPPVLTQVVDQSIEWHYHPPCDHALFTAKQLTVIIIK